MKSRILFLVGIILFSLCSVSAQNAETPFSSSQRDFSIKFPLAAVYGGQIIEVELTSRFSLIKLSDYRIEWSISGGKIINGHGTPIIKIETDENADQLKVDAEILNFATDVTRANGSIELAQRPHSILVKEVDDLLSLDKTALKALLQEYFDKLNQNTSAQGFIYIYPKKNGDFTKIKARIIKSAQNNKVEISRITVSSKLQDNNKVKFYIVPNGSKSPS
jgi:hypothetical protein